MKRIFTSIVAVVLFAIFFTLAFALSGGLSKPRAGLVPAAQAQELERTTQDDNEKAAAYSYRRGCSLRSVAGKYGILIQGTLLPPNVPVATPGVAVGTFEVDWNGNVTGADTLSLGGQIIPRTYTGTISVNPDCTFTSRFTVNSGPLTGLVVNSSGVIVDSGNEIQFVETDPNTIFTAVAKRL